MKNKEKALIIISPGFPKDESDTTCLPINQAFVKTLNKNYTDINIIVVAVQYPFERREYSWFGNRIISFNAKKGMRARPFNWLRLWHAFRQLYDQYQVIGFLSFWCMEYSVTAKRFAKAHNIPAYNWLLGQDAKKGNKFIRFLRPHADEMIALSDIIKNEFRENYGISAQHVIPFGLDTTMFPAEAHQRDIDILGAGSLIPLKQYNVFIEVIRALANWLPNIKATLLGGGPEENALNSQVAALQLKGNVSLAGEQPHQSILKTMQRTKVFLHTSAYEGFGTVCLEALYAGAHVISFYQPMTTPIKNWHVVCGKDEMIQLAFELLNDPELSHEMVAPYTMNKTADEVMKLFGS